MSRKNKRESSFPMNVQLRILPTLHLFIFKVLKLFFIRSVIDQLTIVLLYKTNSATLFKQPKLNRLFEDQFSSLVYLGPKFYNHVSVSIINIVNLKVFCQHFTIITKCKLKININLQSVYLYLERMNGKR